MTEINQQELQEFWEWCGFHYHNQRDYPSWFTVSYPNGQTKPCLKNLIDTPSLNLNNLFKYAVPKLLPKYAPIEMVAYPSNSYGYHFSVMKKYSGDHKDPALAFYQAIQKARRTANG